MTAPGEAIAAEVAGEPILVADVDRREARLRDSPAAAALPARGTSEGRQLRRWLVQVLVAERVVAVEAARRRLTEAGAPGPLDVLPDATARIEIGSIPAALLDSMPLARALFAAMTADVEISDDEVTRYHARNRDRFAEPPPADTAGWLVFDPTRPAPRQPLPDARRRIEVELIGAARRRSFARWLDAARADLVRLRPGFEHPADPTQPDNTHRH